MLHTHDRFLQLLIHYQPVSHNNDVIKDDFIVCIMQRAEAISQPCNGVCLAGACAMLDQIILRAAVLVHISQQLSNNIKLMITRKNNIF